MQYALIAIRLAYSSEHTSWRQEGDLYLFLALWIFDPCLRYPIFQRTNYN
jgi:hypothetical protein